MFDCRVLKSIEAAVQLANGEWGSSYTITGLPPGMSNHRAHIWHVRRTGKAKVLAVAIDEALKAPKVEVDSDRVGWTYTPEL